MNISDKAFAFIQKYFSFDLRAFALLRIGVASVILLDCCIRLTDLEAHYTDQGVLPLKALFEYAWNDYHFSFHTINGLWWFQLCLFILAMCSAIALLIGYRTKAATVLSWLLMCSLHSRNPLILQGGDDLIRMILFWGMFLPWQKYYSIDSRNETHTQPSYSGLPAFALLLQIFYVYFFSALEKNSAEWGSEGTALYYAFSYDQVTWPLGKILYWYPDLLNTLTHIVYYIEFLGPFLFLIPFKNQWFRSAGVLLFVGFQTGIGLTLFVGLFFIINLVVLLGLLPAFFMDWFDAKTITIRNFISKLLQSLQPSVSPKHSYQPYINIALLFFMTYVLIWNIGNTPQSRYALNKHIRWVGHLLRLDQNWGVFAPGVIKDDGWYILIGTTSDGKQIDLYRDGKEVSYKKPTSIVTEIKNDRWRKYGEQYIMIYNGWMRGYYCNYIKRKWNESHPDMAIYKLEVVYMMEFSKPDYQYEIPTRESLFTCEY